MGDDLPILHFLLKLLINRHTPMAAKTRAETK
jgi:hypothetical protein